MRVLTRDEVDCVSGGLEMKPWEGGFYSANWQNSVADSFSMMSAYSGLGQQMNDYHQQQVEQQKAINNLFNISDQSAPNSAFGTGYLAQHQSGNATGYPLQSQDPFAYWLCIAGNTVAAFADKLGNVSGKLEMTGLVVAGAGFVAAQPAVAAPGLALAATGGVGNIGAGAMQFGAGLLQGASVGDFSNSGYAALSIVTGLTLSRAISGPSLSGHLTLARREGEAFAQTTATVVGGANDIWSTLIDAASPRQVDCSGGN
jgi:hypothetical protein